MEYSDKQINSLIVDIYEGVISVENMPEDLYFAIAEYLKKSLYEGFGGSLIDFSGKPLELLTELRENIYLFSGAKTYQTVKAMDAMITEDGEKRSFKEFKELAKQEYDLFNVTWAKTEYDTAVGQGQNAYLWNKIEEDKDVLPLLQYTAVMDANTSDICAPLDGIIKPVDDPFWDVFMPLNHYNCRCSVLQLSEGEISKDIKAETKQVAENMDDSFKANVAKDGFIFPPDHPYFDVAPQDKKYAKDNFGFDIPIKDNSLIEKPGKLITDAEAGALKAYTKKSYIAINEHLRESTPINNVDLNRIERISSALNKMDKYEGTVYRVADFWKGEIENIVKDYKVGGIISDKGFMSTTQERKIIEKFGSMSNKDKIIYQIESKRGIDISKYSGFESEKEVLFDKGSIFKVDSISNRIIDGVHEYVVKITQQ